MNTKFQDIVSKITFHTDTPEDLALHIRSWVKKTEPLILQKRGKFHKPSNTIVKKWR